MIDFTDSKLVEEDGSPQICQIFTDVKANENTDNDIDPRFGIWCCFPMSQFQ